MDSAKIERVLEHTYKMYAVEEVKVIQEHGTPKKIAYFEDLIDVLVFAKVEAKAKERHQLWKD